MNEIKPCSISGQTRTEEILNCLIHGLGLLLSIAALIVLVIFSSIYGTVWHIVSCSIYGATLVSIYAASIFYHGSSHLTRKQLFQFFDHACIYLLIAGTYTPFTFVPLHGGWGWSLFGVVWGLAITGIILKIFFVGRFDFLFTSIYLLMGWLCVIAVIPLFNNLSLQGFLWLVLGGLFYTIGVIFYTIEKIPYNHVIWHLFVLAGSVCHFLSILSFVIPSS